MINNNYYSRLLFLFFSILFFVCVSVSGDWSMPLVATKTVAMAPTPTLTAACIPGMSTCASRSFASSFVSVEQLVPESALFPAVWRFDRVFFLVFVVWSICVSVAVVSAPVKDHVGFVSGPICENSVPVSVVVASSSLVDFSRHNTPPSFPSSHSSPFPSTSSKQKKLVVLLNRATILRNQEIAKKYFKK